MKFSVETNDKSETYVLLKAMDAFMALEVISRELRSIAKHSDLGEAEQEIIDHARAIVFDALDEYGIDLDLAIG